MPVFKLSSRPTEQTALIRDMRNTLAQCEGFAQRLVALFLTQELYDPDAMSTEFVDTAMGVAKEPASLQAAVYQRALFLLERERDNEHCPSHVADSDFSSTFGVALVIGERRAYLND